MNALLCSDAVQGDLLTESQVRGWLGTDASLARVSSFKHALKRLHSAAFDLVIVSAPFTNRKDFDHLAEIVQMAAGAMVVAYGTEHSASAADQALHCGADEYIPASAYPDSIIQKIIRLIQQQHVLREKLDSTQDRYLNLIQASPDGITMSDLNGLITFASRKTLEMHGYSTPEELLGRSAFELIADDDIPKAEQYMADIFSFPGFLTTDYHLKRKDGSLFIGELNISPVRDRDGNPTGFLAMTRDISQRRQAEQALDQARLKLQQTLASVSDVIWNGEMSSDGTYEHHFISPVIEKITGYPVEYFQLSTHNWSDIIHPEDHPRVDLAQAEIFSGRISELELEYRIQAADGSIRWVRDSQRATAISPGCYRVDAVMSDITERRRIQEGYRKLVEESLQELLIIQDNRIVFANAAAFDIGDLHCLQTRRPVHRRKRIALPRR